ncbi:MAG: hypothetical protein ABSE71_01435 [Candidatus Micrarchaeaceae archaeon]|jgi:hypothetical protein|nr:hypothetical protein [Candidatus Micrarchaeota archaeon]HII09829.1 hypothetical protein [Candidatus Micrarchaeota archaeon]
MAEKAGLCRICGKIGKHTCKLCGRFVCDDDYDSSAKMCTVCKRGRKVKS